LKKRGGGEQRQSNRKGERGRENQEGLLVAMGQKKKGKKEINGLQAKYIKRHRIKLEKVGSNSWGNIRQGQGMGGGKKNKWPIT